VVPPEKQSSWNRFSFANENNKLIMSMHVREDKYHLHGHPSMSF
jgi:hypothetical protein